MIANCRHHRNISSSRFLAEILGSAAIALVFSLAGIAEELRIVDSNGLTRALKVLRGKCRVVVSLVQNGAKEMHSDPGSITCTASNVDGIVGDVTIIADSEGTCLFDSLKSGAWRISTAPAALGWSASIEEQS